MKTNQERCVLCGKAIDSLSLSFEQRLIGDQDFCRNCWNEIMIEGYDESPLPILLVARSERK